MSDGLAQEDTAPLGELLARASGWQPPERRVLQGRHVRLEPLSAARHAADLFTVSHGDPQAREIWTYLFQGPFADEAAYRTSLESAERSSDPLFFAIVELADERAKGQASLMRITPEMGVIEVGNIWYAPTLQRTPAATEAMLLLFSYVFDDLGYRRLEWKCNALNAASRRAALRLGFTFEGVFRQHMVVKGRNRDTAWYAMLDGEWPERRTALHAWLAPENFDEHGRQKRRLEEIRA
jgi:RimJ/RimL family protein N-acetyltransferase